jgi:hypothetical protein
VFDRQDKFRAKAEQAFRQLREVADLPDHEKIGSLDFEDRRNSPELQGADIFVYELRKYEMNQRGGRPRATRWPMTQFALKEERNQVIRADVTVLLNGIPPPS